MKEQETGFIELRCGVQHYAWGDPDFIPALLGTDNTAKKPVAELWIGVHPDLPSNAVVGNDLVPLDRLIEPDSVPFLLKVLAAAAPLSLQAHPSRAAAEEGFARENAAGIALGAAHRNYRDRNHKPELIVALTDFYALRGFRPLPDIERTLKAVPEFRELAAGFDANAGSLRRLYSQFMTRPQEQVDRMLGPLVQRLAEEHRRKAFTRSDREYWVLRADSEYSGGGHHDRGLLSAYLLNLIRLRPGEGMYLPSGILHAYLEGAGMEIMANSNNVLRGGWTPKHVDVPELLRNVIFEGGDAEIITGRQLDGTTEWVHDTPAPEFQLSRIELDVEMPYRSTRAHAMEIFLVAAALPDWPVTLKTPGGQREFARGAVFLVRADTAYELEADAPVTLFKATVPFARNDAGTPPLLFRGAAPAELAFGTSGLRGLVTDITDLEAYINTRGFLDYALEIGDIPAGGTVSIACDLRPSSDSPDRSILRAVVRAIEDAGLAVDNLGQLPTPALACYAIDRKRPGIMVTGSHIPFDRNGIKFNKSTGEVLKRDEALILQSVRRVREIEYGHDDAHSLFAKNGMFKPEHRGPSPPVNSEAREFYIRRYLDFFPPNALQGLRVVFYQHSAVGRDILVELMTALGAHVIPMGRSENFVPIDTEAISEDRLRFLQQLVDEAARAHGSIDAVVSTDGDSDRPLVAGISAGGQVAFFGGDVLGIVVAEFLNADAVVVPISCNDAVDLWALERGIAVQKTRIGSPYVIAGMQHFGEGTARRVVGWEANGGFLTGTDIERAGHLLKALPTRDATLPLLAVLSSANARHVPVEELFRRLPRRFSRAGLLDNFPTEVSRAMLLRFSSDDSSGTDAIRRELEQFFRPADGFSAIARINTLDGIRVFFENGDIVHVRPSGNAPQLRVYAVADSPERAAQIVACALREPDGILRKLGALEPSRF
jgi:phosphomannomutase